MKQSDYQEFESKSDEFIKYDMVSNEQLDYELDNLAHEYEVCQMWKN